MSMNGRVNETDAISATSEPEARASTGAAERDARDLPNALAAVDDILARCKGRSLAVFLDYDGTLTPIVDDPDQALIADDMRAAVSELADRCSVALVSGRDLPKLKRLARLPHVTYAGSHGFDIETAGGRSVAHEEAMADLPALDQAERRLRERLCGVAGAIVERKRFAIAVHFRQVAAQEVYRVQTIAKEVLSEQQGLREKAGKMIVELQPDVAWNKGRAVLWLLEQMGAAGTTFPIYIGDDVTDEDAFQALKGRGIGILVRDAQPRSSAAEYALENVAEVRRFLETLSGRLSHG
jgi:trehalose 6-phosphate phosphatase